MTQTTTPSAAPSKSQPGGGRRRPERSDDEKKDGDDEEEPLGIRLGGMRSSLSRDPHVCLAIYIAMAHAGLFLFLVLLYGLAKLLQEYRRPIQWALLCSMPLRELHTALISFWAHPLRLGLVETLLAIPLAVLRSATGSLIDSHAALLHLFRRGGGGGGGGGRRRRSRIGFSKLVQWLVSFGVFVLLHERIGLLSLFVFFVFASIAYGAGARPPTLARTLSAISSVRQKRGKKGIQVRPAAAAQAALHTRISRYLTSVILNRLYTLVAVSLIIIMIIGSVSGFLFFSYKIGIEGRNAFISLKTHIEEQSYSKRIGLQQWMDDHDVPEMIESWTTKFYLSVSDYVDSVAIQYNATDIVDGLKQYLMKPLDSHPSNESFPLVYKKEPRYHVSEKLQYLLLRLQKQEWNLIYSDICGLFNDFLSVITREDLVEKVKSFALQSIDISKRVVASSTVVLSGSAQLVFKVVHSVISGAAGLLHFMSQLMVFFWLLYYLITSESGGVMDHILDMLPISETTKVRCAHVLGHAVSTALLTTVKVALFQGALTYLLFRFYRIHFLYVSTFMAWMSAILPITPFWLSSIPAAVQLAVETRYVEAVVLTAVYLFFLEYGTLAIQDEIPGQNAYVTGLSILGGMAVFPSVLEGAIMGPLLMTVMIAMKNLYAEFVLLSSKGSRWQFSS